VRLREGNYLEGEVDEQGRIVMTKSKRKRITLRAGRSLTPKEMEELIELGMKKSLAFFGG